MGRDAFVDQVWQWKRQSGGAITEQMRALGDSCDWTRERFTLDEGLSAAVREVFVRLHEQGFIYRGQRIINWSPGLMTAISDIEVEYKDVDGQLVHITYPFADGDGIDGITVATTRAETMLGDTGVAVHPGDDRYRHLVGREVRLPLMGRDIPVVADEAVDPDFGTGAVKVTPAHDPLDFSISLRTGLVPVQVIDWKRANVARAMSLVPEGVRTFFRMVAAMYTGTASDFDRMVWDHRPLARPQVELLAARVSALNQCFY